MHSAKWTITVLQLQHWKHVISSIQLILNVFLVVKLSNAQLKTILQILRTDLLWLNPCLAKRRDRLPISPPCRSDPSTASLPFRRSLRSPLQWPCPTIFTPFPKPSCVSIRARKHYSAEILHPSSDVSGISTLKSKMQCVAPFLQSTIILHLLKMYLGNPSTFAEQLNSQTTLIQQ